MPLTARNLTRSRRANAFARRRYLNATALIAGNALAWTLTALIAHQVTRWVPSLHGFRNNWGLLFLLHTLLCAGANLLPGWGLGAVAELRYTVQVTGLLLISVALTAGLLRGDWLVLITAAFVGVLLTVFLVGLRALIKYLLLRAGQWGVPVVVYGAARSGQKVIAALQSEQGLGFHPVAVYDDDPALRGESIGGVPVAGDTEDWTYEAPVAILAMPGAGRARHVALLDGPLTVYRKVIVIPDLFDVQSLWARTTDLGGVLGISLNQQLADPVARRTKRAIDLSAVVLSSPFWLPLCLLVGVFIWLEDRHHPVFLQPRLGLGGRTFNTWKFRTMVPNAEAVLQERLTRDPALRQEWEANHKLRRDPRITRVGSFLRKTSLDELPQLVNVLLGDMALVGPRPLPGYHYEKLPAGVQGLRREVRPGMTGLWQVSGRSDAGDEGMLVHDPYYVRNWSIWLDMVILLRTFRAVVRSAGAY
ncbi:exopolysaccharide biosynthesis polyprenyl glycosylphosphotransferase [Deinococcus sedimenti]|uniref:Undecaprenyl-phosphate galactose phosphotransferase WbaP n=1 Tax=Deinococcus sedimenti TaxID=1867090 RepID=A0ABQ2S3D7_9DEIO|nr:exopolysaccharide biosynthesis polyprenyl glycosylphosphotransferase [Deinococcus sedimenti]GGR93162.1 undecaprenyl-phosphate galactose phosphotransferase WbaP [Deinococcus sedimenti]